MITKIHTTKQKTIHYEPRIPNRDVKQQTDMIYVGEKNAIIDSVKKNS